MLTAVLMAAVFIWVISRRNPENAEVTIYFNFVGWASNTISTMWWAKPTLVIYLCMPTSAPGRMKPKPESFPFSRVNPDYVSRHPGCTHSGFPRHSSLMPVLYDNFSLTSLTRDINRALFSSGSVASAATRDS